MRNLCKAVDICSASYTYDRQKGLENMKKEMEGGGEEGRRTDTFLGRKFVVIGA